MNPAVLAACVTALCVSATAQISEISNMTVSFSTVDMDSLPPGPTTLTAIRNAGTNGGAPISGLTLTPNAAALGFYNVNVPATGGRGLALDLNNNMAVINPLNQFNPFDLAVDLEVPARQFGISVGDWTDDMVLEFFFLGQPVGSILTTLFADPSPKFFASSSSFDRVTIRASRAAGNWLATSLHVQNVSAWRPVGTGCAGTNGVPTMTLAQEPAIGQTFQLDMINLPTAAGAWLMVTGFSDTVAPGFGPLPFDLTAVGMPGCFMFCDVGTSSLRLHGGLSASFQQNIPNNPILAGIQFFNQGYVLDAGANQFGGTSSNAGQATIQP